MNKLRIILIFGLCILLLPTMVHAATIHGIVYDLSLNRVEEAQITIDTTPFQRQITKGGEYLFEVPEGVYSITAEYYQDNVLQASTKEKISIKEQGSYVYDLILFPVVSEDLNIEEDLDLSDKFLIEEERKWTDLIFILLFISVLGILIYLYQLKKEPHVEEMEGELMKFFKFIKKEKRTTQKELRKAFPQSEAKISLMVAELEEKGLIKKIKKGRGNIILLQKPPKTR